MSTFHMFRPNEDGSRWVRISHYEAFSDWEVACDSLLSGRREALRGEEFVVAWSEDEGYRAVAARAEDPPEPAEVLQSDLDAYLEERLELRPTLLGGEPDYEAHDEWERYDEIRE